MIVIEQKKMKITDLIPAPYNPRTITPAEFEKLKNSIARYGHLQVLVVNKRNNHVVGGNQTLKALTELGYKKVDCKIVDLNDEDEKALNIALNRIEGKWEYGQLGTILAEIKTSPVDIKFTGMDDIEIKNLSNLNIETTKINYSGDNDAPPEIKPGTGPQAPTNNGKDEYSNMPEFKQNDETGVQSILVHFRTREDVEEFAELIGQEITEKTKYIWHPKLVRHSYTEKTYVEPTEADDGK